MKKILVLVLAFILALPMVANSESATATLQDMYAQAELLMAQGDYTGAAAKFEALGAYSDASQMTMYCKAIDAAETLGLYTIAVEAFKTLGDFRDSEQMAEYYRGRLYEADGNVDISIASDEVIAFAVQLNEQAQEIYQGQLLFKDSMIRMATCGEKIKELKGEQSRRTLAANEAAYQQALALEQKEDYEGAIQIYRSIETYLDSAERLASCIEANNEAIYQAALTSEENGDYVQAIGLLRKITFYKDSNERIPMLQYKQAEALMAEGKWDEASKAFEKLGYYSDARERVYEPYRMRNYVQAEELLAEGKYNEARILFEKNHNYPYHGYGDPVTYKDSGERAAAIVDAHWKDILRTAAIGDYVPLGTYEQDNDLNNGKEYIEWLVIDKQDDRLLVISRYVLDFQRIHTEEKWSEGFTWENCVLRTWLNQEFLNEAFSTEEQVSIPVVTNSPEIYKPNVLIDLGSDTQDKVFLLSVTEFDHYFPYEGRFSRKCSNSAYVEARVNERTSNIPGEGYGWLLRTQGTTQWRSTMVTLYGVVGTTGSGDCYYGIRPAIWIKLTP